MQRLILFAKFPRLGKVKTRLVPPLSPEQALTTYRAFYADQIMFLRSFSESHDLEVCIDKPWRFEPGQNRSPWGLRLTEQGDGDLGQRMFRAIRRSRSEGRDATMVIGADTPTLPRSHVLEASRRLAEGRDGVVAPSVDGGYVLIGLREPRPELFHAVPWGGPDVLATTMAHAKACGITLDQLPEWYDVDDVEMLRRLASELDTPAGRRRASCTARYLLDLRGAGVI